ncbi:MAG: gamma-glutamyl-gamma-aminobutyrate hydrolase family protein [Candidatus Acidiferrales bacterium]
MNAESNRTLLRIGVPYRTRKEELSGDHDKVEKYLHAVLSAGGEPVEVSLGLSSDELKAIARTLDAVVLPGSPADVQSTIFRATRHPNSADPDLDRERTDFALLEQAFAENKPVLAICYGTQSLNVFLGGTLVQDIPSELHTTLEHQWRHNLGAPEPFHPVIIEPGSRLAELARSREARVNSSHHQSILDLGRDLRVAARAPDKVIEAVEWTGDANWVMGVQWHPERMVETDPLARALFNGLVAAVRKVPAQT